MPILHPIQAAHKMKSIRTGTNDDFAEHEVDAIAGGGLSFKQHIRDA